MGEKKRREQAGTPAPRKANSRKPLAIGVTVLVLAAIVLGVVFLTAAPKPTSDELPVAAPNAAAFPAQLDQYGVSVGAEDAPVVVREFADYQCPACGAFSEASKRLKQEYVEAGKVRCRCASTRMPSPLLRPLVVPATRERTGKCTNAFMIRRQNGVVRTTRLQPLRVMVRIWVWKSAVCAVA